MIVLSHPGLKMCVSTQSRSHLILIQVSRFASHHPRCLDSRLFSIHVASHLNPDPYVCVSSPSMWRLTPIQDTKIASQFHISIPTTPSRIQDMCLTYTRVLFHLDPGSKILVSPPYMYCLNPILVHEITSQLPPDSVSTPSMSWYLYVTSIQVTSHLHPGLKMYVHLYQCPVSPPTRPFTKVAFHLNPCPDISAPSPISLYPRLKMCICTVSSVSRSLDSNLTSIHVTSQLQPGREFGVSSHSRSHVTSIQVTRIAHQLHPSPIPTFPCIKIGSLTQSRSHHTPIHFPRLTSHLNIRS